MFTGIGKCKHDLFEPSKPEAHAMLTDGKASREAGGGYPRHTARAPYGHGRYGTKLAIPLIQHRGQPFKPAPGIPIFQKDPFGKIFCRRPMTGQPGRMGRIVEHHTVGPSGEMGKFMSHWHYEPQNSNHMTHMAPKTENPTMLPVHQQQPNFYQHQYHFHLYSNPRYQQRDYQLDQHYSDEYVKGLPSARSLFYQQLEMKAPTTKKKSEDPEQEVASFLTELNTTIGKR